MTDRNDLTWEESRGVCPATHRPIAGPPLIRCKLPAGHSEAHEGSSHGTFARWATDVQAEMMRERYGEWLRGEL